MSISRIPPEIDVPPTGYHYELSWQGKKDEDYLKNYMKSNNSINYSEIWRVVSTKGNCACTIPFFMMNAEIDLTFYSNHTPEQLANDFRWGLFGSGNLTSEKWSIPPEHDGVKLSDLFKHCTSSDMSNNIKIQTQYVYGGNALRVYINDVLYFEKAIKLIYIGNDPNNGLLINSWYNELYFGYTTSSTTAVGWRYLRLTKDLVKTKLELTSDIMSPLDSNVQPNNHLCKDINNKNNPPHLLFTIKSYYVLDSGRTREKPMDIVITSANTAYMHFEAHDGYPIKPVDASSNNKMKLSSNENGVAKIYAQSDGKATRFSSQADISWTTLTNGQYVYGPCESNKVYHYFREKTQVDVSDLSFENFYRPNMLLNLNARLLDSDGAEIDPTKIGPNNEYFGEGNENDYKLREYGTMDVHRFDGGVVKEDAWSFSSVDEGSLNSCSPREPVSPEYRDEYRVKWSFVGSKYYQPVIYDTDLSPNKNFVVKKARITVNIYGLKERYEYPEDDIKFTISASLDDPDNSIPMNELKLYRVYDGDNGFGIHIFYDTNTCEVEDYNVREGGITYKLSFEGSQTIAPYIKTWESRYYKNDSMLAICEYCERTESVYVKEDAKVPVILTDEDGMALTNKQIQYIVTRSDRQTSYDIYNGTVTTNNEGIANLIYTPTKWGDYQFKFTYEGEGNITPSNVTCVVNVMRLPTALHITGVQDLEIFDKSEVTVQVEGEGHYLPSRDVESTLFIVLNTATIPSVDKITSLDSISQSERLKTPFINVKKNTGTGSNPSFKVEHTESDYGNVKGIYIFKHLADDVYDTVTKAYIVQWSKATPRFEIISYVGKHNPESKKPEVTIESGFNVKVSYGKTTPKPLVSSNIKASLGFKDINNSNSIEVSGTRKGILLNGQGNTNNNGVFYAGFIPLSKGDIMGTFTFVKEEDNRFKRATFSTSTTWYKIKTQMSIQNLGIYNGRYTNLAESENSIDWTIPSPGVSEDYMNVHGIIKTKDTETTYTSITSRDTAIIEFFDEEIVNSQGGLETTPEWTAHVKPTLNSNGEGIIEGRGTTTIDMEDRDVWYFDKEDNPRFYARYKGNDLFYGCTEYMTLWIRKRESTKLTKYLYEIYPPKIRYNVPFNWGVQLTNGDNNALSDQIIEVTFKKFGQYDIDSFYPNTGEIEEYNIDLPSYNDAIRTNNDGILSITNDRYANRDVYVLAAVGSCTVIAKYDKNDLIDRYLPSSLTYNFNVEKDYTILDIKTGTDIYRSCREAMVKIKLTDSLSRGFIDKVFIYYDDGTYLTSKWIAFETPYVTTDVNGNATYYAEPYSGIRKCLGKFIGTWCYLPITDEWDIIYKIHRDYSVNLVNGVAEVPVECLLNSTTGLPIGLYDVQLKYIPPDNGECSLYSAVSNIQPIRKKYATVLQCISAYMADYSIEDEFQQKITVDDYTTESRIPLFLIAELSNIKHDFLVGKEINSKINYKQYESDPNHITDGLGQIERGYVDDRADAINVYNFKYEQERKFCGAKLDVNTYVSKIKPTIEPNPDSLVGYSEVDMLMEAKVYYKRVKCDKFGYAIKKTKDGKEIYKGSDGYDNADYQITTELVANKDVVWRGIGGSTELVRAKTDANGIARAYYHRVTPGEVTIYVTTEEDSLLQEGRVPLPIRTYPKLDTYFIGSYEVTSNMPTYHYDTNIGAILNYTEVSQETGDSVEIHLPNMKVIFRSANMKDKEVTTMSNGYAYIPFVPNSTTVVYEVIFRGEGRYNKTSDVFRIPVKKQTPKLLMKIYRHVKNADGSITKREITPEDVAQGINKLLPNDPISIYLTLTESEDCSNEYKQVDEKTGELVPKGIQNRKFFLSEIGPNGEKRGIAYARTNDQGKIQIIGYKPRYSGTTTIKAEFEGDNYYEARSRTRQAIVSKIPTLILQRFPRAESDGNDIMVTLYENADENTSNNFIPINNDTIPHAKLIFYVNQDNGQINESKHEFAVGETDEYGFCRINGAKLNKIGTSRIRVKYEGSDIYAESSIEYEFEVKSLIDKCNDIRAWQSLQENWYASDGTAKYGLDTYGLNTWDPEDIKRADKYHYGTSKYKLSPRHVLDVCNKKTNEDAYCLENYELRNYCNDLKTEGYQSSKGLHAPTGVILRSKHLKTFENCTIEYKLTFYYDTSDKNKNNTISTRLYGGHFGLMPPYDESKEPDAPENKATAEKGPVRIELYRNNEYIINPSEPLDAKTRVIPGGFPYIMEANVEYGVKLKITATQVTVTITDINENKVVGTETFNHSFNYIGLSPYIFAFTNGTELIIREVKISKN